MSFDLALGTYPDHLSGETLEILKRRIASSAVLVAAEPRFFDPTIPPLGDLEELQGAIDEGEFSGQQFNEFCQRHSLDPNADFAAGRFLQQHWGIDALLIHLPRDSKAVEMAFAELRAISRELNLTLHNPQTGEDIAADSDDALPPGY